MKLNMNQSYNKGGKRISLLQIYIISFILLICRRSQEFHNRQSDESILPVGNDHSFGLEMGKAVCYLYQKLVYRNLKCHGYRLGDTTWCTQYIESLQKHYGRSLQHSSASSVRLPILNFPYSNSTPKLSLLRFSSFWSPKEAKQCCDVTRLDCTHCSGHSLTFGDKPTSNSLETQVPHTLFLILRKTVVIRLDCVQLGVVCQCLSLQLDCAMEKPAVLHSPIEATEAVVYGISHQQDLYRVGWRH